MEIPVELTRIVIRDNSDQQYIYLNEVDGTRGFPIVIGTYEAREIERKATEIKTPRPMTHDLVRLILQALDAHTVKVVINDLTDGTFFANLYIRQGEKLLRVDCRPSDAIALACALSAPIFVEESVMDQVGKTEDTEGI